jgi:glutathione S-transferase
MSDELVFYTNPMSRGRIVRWMLEEVGRPYRTELVPFGPAMKSPEYRAINPMGKVPAIRHGEAAVTNKSLAVEVPKARRGMVGYGSFADVMNALEVAVSKSDYVAGDRFTAADVYVGSHVGWGLEFGSIEKRPAFERYWKRIGTRPAAARAKEMDDALMANQKQPAPAS